MSIEELYPMLNFPGLDVKLRQVEIVQKLDKSYIVFDIKVKPVVDFCWCTFKNLQTE